MPAHLDSPPVDLVDRVTRVFEPGGALARVLPGYEPRSSQIEMAQAVAQRVLDGGVLLVEAGTGTGKTLAYLAPAILSGRKVLVSTGTKNLQEQIVQKDLPVLASVLDRPFTATVMKGRGNYLCLHRLEARRAAGAPEQSRLDLGGATQPEARLLLPIIERWSRRTDTGDRAELSELPDDLPLWHDLSASAETCLGTTCPRYHECFVTRMRQRAADADVVVVNHHLLFADAAVREGAYGEVIPACDVAVLDEAHQLEDVATQYFGVSVSTYRVDELTRDVERAMVAWPSPDRRDAVRHEAERVGERARVLFMELAPRGRAMEERARLTPEGLRDVQEPGQSLVGALERLEAVLALLKDAPSDEVAAAAPAILDDLLALAGRARALRDDLRFLLAASDPEFVFFIEARGRGLFLRAAPIDVSQIVRDQVLDRQPAAILTSATLTVEQSFDHVRSRLGVARAEEVRLPSEFDYSRQAILYLPRRMPDPRDAGFGDAAAREIEGILRRTRGRAFVLFTSYAVLRVVERRLAGALEFPLLVQGQAPRSTLVERFRHTPHAVLLATSSFWQGVDVVGDALSCVIVDKLPFASPGDPIVAARLEAIAARGGEPFGEYQVPVAILALQQGLGRLIRHRTDRGVLAVLDPRIRTRGYGRRFLASLPPAPVTLDPAAIERFFPA